MRQADDFAKIELLLSEILQRLHVIEELPVLRVKPDHYVEAFERGGRRTVDGFLPDMDRKIAQLENISHELSVAIANQDTQPISRSKLWIIAILCGLLGALFAISAERFLPPPLPPDRSEMPVRGTTP